MGQKQLLEEAKKEIRNKKPRMAICYDFDRTLSPDDMQTFTLIPSFKMSVSEFWSESNQLAKENLMDSNLAWMYQLVQYSKIKRKPLKRDYFNEIIFKNTYFSFCLYVIINIMCDKRRKCR